MAAEEKPRQCPECGATQPLSAENCEGCGASLLVDLVVVAPPRFEPGRKQAARVLSGLTGVTVEEAFLRVSQPGATLAGPFSRRRAEELGRHLEGVGVLVGTRPAGSLSSPASEPPARRAPPALLWALLLVAFAALAVAVAFKVLPTLLSPARHPRAPPAPGLNPASGRSPEPARQPGPPPESLEALRPSLARVRGLAEGFGLFAEEERLLTFAHLVSPNDPIQVWLADGRELAGELAFRDEWLDLAEVRVLGADARALAAGDSTLLGDGDAAFVVSWPPGQEVQLRGARIGGLGHPYLGLCAIRISQPRAGGASSGFLLNARGEVVGLGLSAAADEQESVFLPIEYARPPQEPAHLQRWDALLARADEADRREIEALRLRPGQVRLLGVELEKGQATARIEERGAREPAARGYSVEAVFGSFHCTTTAQVSRFVKLDPGPPSPARARRAQWLARHGLEESVWLGSGPVLLERCATDRMAGQGHLVVRGSRGEVGRIPVDGRVLAEAIEAGAKDAERERHAAREQAAALQSRWRSRFRAARERVARVEGEVRMAQECLDEANRGKEHTSPRCAAPGALEKARQAVSRGAENVRSALEALHELEREAALNAIPLEWRQ